MCVCVCVQSLCPVQLFETPGTVAHQAPMFLGILQASVLEWVTMPPPGGMYILK